MTSFNLKLTEILDLQAQGQGELEAVHLINNAFKRHRLLPPLNFTYETKLSSHNVKPKDMHLMFRHIFSKETLLPEDRNFLRRVLLSLFPESLIVSAGKQLAHVLRYQHLSKHSSFTVKNEFIFVLVGSMKIKSPQCNKSIKGGMFFGHHEILDRKQSEIQIKTLQQCSILTLNQDEFKELIQNYFLKLYQHRKQSFPTYFQKCFSSYQQLQICSLMHKVIYNSQKICSREHLIQFLIFISSGGVTGHQEKQKSVFGLKQILDKKCQFSKTIETYEQVVGWKVSVSEFKKILNPKNTEKLHECIKKNDTIEGYSPKKKEFETLRSKHEQQRKRNMRFRKVNFSYNRSRVKTSTTDCQTLRDSNHYSASFMFVREELSIKKKVCEESMRKISQRVATTRKKKYTQDTQYIFP